MRKSFLNTTATDPTKFKDSIVADLGKARNKLKQIGKRATARATFDSLQAWSEGITSSFSADCYEKAAKFFKGQGNKLLKTYASSYTSKWKEQYKTFKDKVKDFVKPQLSVPEPPKPKG